MSPLTDMVAGARGLTAPRSSALLCLSKASCNRGAVAPYMKRSASNRKEAVPVPATLPVDIPEPDMDTNLQVLHLYRSRPSGVRKLAIVVRSGGSMNTKPGVSLVVGSYSHRPMCSENGKIVSTGPHQLTKGGA